MPGRSGVETVTPAWMHQQITAAEYDSWSDGQCAGIEIVDGMVVVRPSASKRHNRSARILATRTYRTGEMGTGTVVAAAPFPVEIDLGQI
ncbi:hypothetical protein AB0L57_05440 [Nocardia sp. NPDC052254]|uniref:hypothetical protein n=1 Tax=Nocardia sp. NPDC052254 TaxID=3155681 RepID=UPI0034406A8C